MQTILVVKKMATTPKSARQLITHKKVLIDGRVLNSPSYIVPVDLEKKITLKVSKKKENKPKEEKENEWNKRKKERCRSGC